MEKSCKVTLIDDDPISHLISTKLLTHFTSFKVESFTDAIEALSRLQWRAANEPDALPDFIFLDIDMPKMDGWAFLEEFQKLPSNVLEKSAVMVLTSSTHLNDIERSKRYAAVKWFYSKPLTEEIIRQIELSCN